MIKNIFYGFFILVMISHTYGQAVGTPYLPYTPSPSFSITKCNEANFNEGYLAVGLPVNSADIAAKQKIEINVVSPGAYNFITNTVNGVSFRASGNFLSQGVQTVELTATGTPVDYTVENTSLSYTVSNTTGINSGSCTFNRKVYIPDQNYTGIIKNDGQHRFLYKAITDNSGKTWLQTNLGSKYNKVGDPDFNPEMYAQSIDDYKAFGSLFQTGRNSDGHELINWTSSNTGTALSQASTNMTSDSGLFYTSTNLTTNYGSILVRGNRFEPGPGMPCPNGFRVAGMSPSNNSLSQFDYLTTEYNLGSSYWYNHIIKLVAPKIYRNANDGALVSMSKRLMRTYVEGYFPAGSTTSPQFVIEGGGLYLGDTTYRDRRLSENTNDIHRGGLDGYPIRCYKP